MCMREDEGSSRGKKREVIGELEARPQVKMTGFDARLKGNCVSSRHKSTFSVVVEPHCHPS